MERNHRPIHGSMQHTHRFDHHLSWMVMARRGAKRGYVAAELRAAFRANLSHALELRFPGSKNLAQSLYDLVQIPKENTNRWLHRGGVPLFDQLQQLARALNIRPYQLLLTGLDLGEDERPQRPRPIGPGPTPLNQPSTNR